MTSDFNDFNLAGIFCLLIGSLILAGFPSAVKDAHMETVAFLGSNPFTRKNQIIRKHERCIGVLWLFVGTTFQILGFSTTKITPFWLNPTLEAIGCVIITAGILKVTPLFVHKISSREFKPLMIEMHREMFEKAESVIMNNGLFQNEVGIKNITMSASDIEKRFADAAKRLNQIGELLDSPRKEGESGKEYLERLKPYFITPRSKE